MFTSLRAHHHPVNEQVHSESEETSKPDQFASWEVGLMALGRRHRRNVGELGESNLVGMTILKLFLNIDTSQMLNNGPIGYRILYGLVLAMNYN